MPSNESVSRTVKKNRKAERTRRIIWAIIVLVAAILVVLKVWEVDFNSIRRNISGKGGVVASVADNVYPLSLDSSKNVKIVPQNDKLTVLTNSSCTVLNPTTGQKDSTIIHGYSNPIMKTAGSYICIFDQGATRYRLDNLHESIYEESLESPVLTADVAKNGTVIYAVQGIESKSQLIVVNKGLKKLIDLKVNSGYIVSVAIDASGKRCAFATVNSKNAKLITTINTINIGDKKERASMEIEGSDLLEMKYCSSDLFLICNDRVSRVTNQKKLKDVFKKGEVNTCCYNYTGGGELVYVYSKYSSANENYLTYINANGRVKTTVEISQRPKYVSSSSNEMTVLFTDKIVSYSLTNGEEKGSVRVDDSVSIVHKLSTKCFICRHQLIDVTELKMKEKEK